MRAPSRRPCRSCARTSPSSTTPSRRRAPCAGDLEILGHAEALEHLDEVRARTLDGDRVARRGPASSTRWSSSTSCSTPRRCARRWRLGGLLPPGEARARRRPRRRLAVGHRPGRQLRRWARRRRRLLLRQRAPAPRGRRRLPSRSPAPRHQRDVAVASSEGGGYVRREWWSDEGWAWKEEYDITHHRAWRTGRLMLPSVTCPGSRPTPSPGQPPPVFRRRPSGRRRRPGAVAAGSSKDEDRVGVDVEQVRRLPRLRRASRTRSTPRSSSATTTASCAAAHGPPIPAWSPHVPQLGPTPAPADLRRRPVGPRHEGLNARMEPILAPRSASTCAPTSTRATANAGRRRPRRPHPPVQGAAAQALLRRRRRRSVRPDLRAARVLPDARRALDPRGALRATSPRSPARRSSSSWVRARPRRPACCCSALSRRRDAAPLRAARRHRGDGARCRAVARRRVPRAARCTASSVTSSATSTTSRRPTGPRIVAFLGGTIGNFPPGSRRRFLRSIAARCSARTTCCCSAPTS